MLYRIDPATPNPEGFCETWRGTFDSDRRVHIMAALYEEVAPGLEYLVGYEKDKKTVTGTFYVRCGHTLDTVKELMR